MREMALPKKRNELRIEVKSPCRQNDCPVLCKNGDFGVL